MRASQEFHVRRSGHARVFKCETRPFEKRGLGQRQATLTYPVTLVLLQTGVDTPLEHNPATLVIYAIGLCRDLAKLNGTLNIG